VIDPVGMADAIRTTARQVDLFEAGKTTVERLRAPQKFACYSSLTDEWYTPPFIIEAARAAMGGIDLDPASCAPANRVVQATRFYSERQDGLIDANSWSGRVWLNPPYGGNAEGFVNRLLRELTAGTVTQAVVLPSAPSLCTKWCDAAIRVADAVGISRGRWRFTPGNGQPVSSPNGGSAVLYYGARREAFADAFGEHAHVMFPAWKKGTT
jgi:ParB family chromosome partitioning protein